MIVTYHVPGDTPHVERWNEEPPRSRMEAKCLEIGAVCYTPEESDAAGCGALVGDADGRVSPRLSDLCAPHLFQAR